MSEESIPSPGGHDNRPETAGSERLALPGGRRAGAHLPRAHSLVGTAHRAREIGATALQIFTDNPTAWRRRSEPPEELPEFRAALAELDIGPVAIHASYLINLAGPDQALFERSLSLLVAELQGAAAYAATFVNVHVGSHRGAGREAGIARVIEAIVLAAPHADPGVTLVLENGSGGGDQIGAQLEDLAAILDEAARRHVDHPVAFCLDTAHLWGAGYDISRPEGVDDVLTSFDRLVGLDRLRMIHLNDSVSALGSRHDRHTHIGDGEIGAAGLRRFVTHPALDHVAFYLETPGTDQGLDAVNVGRIADMAAGRDLRPMPPVPPMAPPAPAHD